jgi:hypothetical protein
MTDRQNVKFIYPRAACYKNTLRNLNDIPDRRWQIWGGNFKFLANGSTQKNAWKNAWERLQSEMVKKLES